MKGFNRQHIFRSAREMFLWSAHENFQNISRADFLNEILGPAHNGGCACCFVAMEKWRAVAKKRDARQQQTRSLWFHITNPETSDHYFIEWQSLPPT